MPDSLSHKNVVLCGGGHCHALLLRQWGQKPLPGVRLTLITPEPLGLYSGLLPGHLAGSCTHADAHIDLARLCRSAGASLRQARVRDIDTARRQVVLDDDSRLGYSRPGYSRPGYSRVDYDLLSLDIGGAADLSVPGVAAHAIPVKPVAGFIARWHAVRDALRTATIPRQIVIAGGGAGSVELTLALAQAAHDDQAIRHKPQFTLLTRDARLLPLYPDKVLARVLQRCEALGIRVLTHCDASAVTAHQLHADTRQGLRSINFDHLFWCTRTAAPAWLRSTGLALNGEGFVAVDDTLRSTSHADIFAVGDVAHVLPHGVPKAGVHAVKQAPVLLANLRAVLQDQALVRYRPRRHYLSLLDLGKGTAAGALGSWGFAGSWVWHWKRRIDQAFMRQFHALPESSTGSEGSDHG